jgi:hypothetical protein
MVVSECRAARPHLQDGRRTSFLRFLLNCQCTVCVWFQPSQDDAQKKATAHATQLEVQTRDAAEAVKANATLRAELAVMESALSKQQASVEADLRARDQRTEELKLVKAELAKRNKQVEKLQQQIGDGSGS